MSGRLVKKVLKEQEQEQANQQERWQLEDLYSGGDDSESSPLSSSINPFHLLNDQDQVCNSLSLFQLPLLSPIMPLRLSPLYRTALLLLFALSRNLCYKVWLW